ncbi:F0F1 ATP synthase subunit B family protein [Pseudophaeobacter flagellatus]|uniref:F0F1 ATP synthase subunit B family protein n=1 Tax=Pseudophaeobacter flagellatus TaxID=2899119 RepID=UPI001E37B77B|nr:hypothetical protein [Pseudophaeobacter flagellatus]MCD9148781.1 hypothetical protein [Pseudophaeobacter flagellatus]
MQIDWITVAAQIANFLVLVWLLQRLLYRPVVRAMRNREAAIRSRFAEAEKREAKAAGEVETLKQQQLEFQQRRAALLAQAQQEAQDLEHRLEAEARERVAAQRAAWESQIDRETAAFLVDLRREAAGHVGRVARRVLNDLAGARLEEAMADTFIAQLNGLTGKSLASLRAETTSGGRITVASAFDLPDPLRNRLRKAVRAVVYENAQPDFVRDPQIGCGIRLKVRGQTLQWNVSAYLDDLEKEIGVMIGREDRQEAAE